MTMQKRFVLETLLNLNPILSFSLITTLDLEVSVKSEYLRHGHILLNLPSLGKTLLSLFAVPLVGSSIASQ